MWGLEGKRVSDSGLLGGIWFVQVAWLMSMIERMKG